ncbi:UNVERIFIED_CONTAM: hypothetical protein GTU68_000720 [Idotea baltica]|nr:hypothetical protein [Idotea baltica]
MLPTTILQSIIFAVTLAIKFCSAFYLSSRTVTTNSGDLRGLIVKPNNRALNEVELFLGVPYASPPLGNNRFMPPKSHYGWKGVRSADSLPPVCPQKLPDVSNRRESLKRMPLGRYNYLQRLIPHLRNQSENCLFLNIYTPVRGRLERVLFIMGSSVQGMNLFFFICADLLSL